MHLTLCKFVKLHCIQGYSWPMLLQDGSFVVLCHVLHCSFFLCLGRIGIPMSLVLQQKICNHNIRGMVANSSCNY